MGADQGPLVVLISGGFWGQQGKAGCRRDQDRSLALSCPQVAVRNVSPGTEVRRLVLWSARHHTLRQSHIETPNTGISTLFSHC